MSLAIFTTSYIETALWSSSDNTRDDGGDPLDANYTADDLAPEARAEIEADCKSFYDGHRALWSDNTDECAGHDFWLTRNGHGAGFWDGGYENGEELTKASKTFGTCDLYVGDDGMLYV